MPEARTAAEVEIASRLPDGTLFLQEPRLDPVTGRAEITYHWHGPQGGGEKRASVRIYAVTELISLLDDAEVAPSSPE